MQFAIGEIIGSTIISLFTIIGAIPTLFFGCRLCDRDQNSLIDKMESILMVDEEDISKPEIVEGICVEPNKRDYEDLVINSLGQICKNNKIHYSNYYGVGEKFPSHASIETDDNGHVVKALLNRPPYRVKLKLRK